MAGNDRIYKLMDTRPRVLANSFRESRDRWKEKCQNAKEDVKSLKGRLRDVENSRSKWRTDAEHALSQQKLLQEKINDLSSELILSAAAIAEAEKKKISLNTLMSRDNSIRWNKSASWCSFFC